MKTHNTIMITAQALSITSQLLAIGIEVGILAGGYLLYKKLTEEPEQPVVQQTPPSKFSKFKKIFKAVLS